MSRLYLFITLCLCFYILMHTRLFKSISQGWRKKTFPGKKNVTMFDVRNMILKGDKISAIRFYQEIFKTDAKEAQRAVEDLAKSIHKKK